MLDSSETLYLRRLTLRLPGREEDFDLPFVDDDGDCRKTTLLLGDHASGKSLLLKALALTLAPEPRSGSARRLLDALDVDVGEELSLHLELTDPGNPSASYAVRARLRRQDDGAEEWTREVAPRPIPGEALFACGYGAIRGVPRVPSFEVGPLDALTADEPVPDGERFLTRLLRSEAEADRARVRPLVDTLEAVLGVEGFSPSKTGLRVLQDDVERPYRSLEAGPRALAAWVTDLFRRSEGEPKGIVLVDDLDAHLHPGDQKRLLPELRRRLPGIQLIATCHAPMTLVNADEGRLFAVDLGRSEMGIRPLESPRRRMADTILRGEWFGLASTVDDVSEKLLQSFREAVRERRSKDEIRRRRAAVEQRLGRLFESPLDPMALQIAEEVRRSAGAPAAGTPAAGTPAAEQQARGRRARGDLPRATRGLGVSVEPTRSSRGVRSVAPPSPGERDAGTVDLDTPDEMFPMSASVEDDLAEEADSAEPADLPEKPPRDEVLDAARRLRERLRRRSFSPEAPSSEDSER